MSTPAAPTASVRNQGRGKLSLPIQILYGLGEIPVTVTMGLFGTYVLLFYNSVMRMDGTLAGIGITAGLVVDAVLDPYIGFRSDRAKWALGRRQSFMLAGCLGMGPFCVALLSPPQHLAGWPLFFWLMISSLGFRLSFATYRIPYLSLGAELTTDYDGRTRVIAIRSLLGLAGMAGAATLPFLLFFRRAAAGGDPKLRYAGYPEMGLAFGAIMTGLGLVAVLGTLSKRSFAETSAGHGELREFFGGMAAFFRIRDFRVLWLAFTLSSLATVVNFNLTVHFLKWYAGIEDHRWLSTVQGSFYGGAATGVAAWIWIAKRGEKRNMYVVSVFGLVIVLAMATLLVGEGHLLKPGHWIPLAAGEFVAGLFASALWVLPFSMMADVVDEDELRSGARREGACFGIMNFAEKIASGLALLLSGTLLTHFVHLSPGEGLQSAESVRRIGVAYGLIPAGVLAAAAFLVTNFRLTRKRVSEIQTLLT